MHWSSFALLVALHPATQPEPPGWRLRYVDLHIAVDPAERRLDGMARLALVASPGAADLVLDFGDSMRVDAA